MIMTQAKPPARPNAAQVAAEALLRANEAIALNQETNRLVKELRDGLLAPQPGYSRSFVDRVTQVVLEAEAGKIVGERFVWYAKVLTAIGTIGTAIYVAAHWGSQR
jgi:hypothetical protein